MKTEQQPMGVCPNCQQWQWRVNDARQSDCLHECRKRGFAPLPVEPQKAPED